MKSKLCAPRASQGKSVEHQGVSEQIISLSTLRLTISPLTFHPHFLTHPPSLSLLHLSQAISFSLSSPAPCLHHAPPLPHPPFLSLRGLRRSGSVAQSSLLIRLGLVTHRGLETRVVATAGRKAKTEMEI